MPITIQEIIASDTISQLVDKTNFNFDQILLNGGGPAGPKGIPGPTGPAGGRGPKGTRWYEDTSTASPGATPLTAPPTSTPLVGDYYLQFNGQVWEYNGTTWVITTIDLQGPKGDAGVSGGYGLATGAPIFNQENILYNGPIGLNNGANTTNEGVPAIMVAGVTSQTIPFNTIPFTSAYIVPEDIIIGNGSDQTSMLIHQRNSNSRAIVFHGGVTPGFNDGFEQTNPAILTNIRIGKQDRLILDVPTPATGAVSITDMYGFELLTQNRSQFFYAGGEISMESGSSPALPFGGGDFKINVGSGGALSPAGNKFQMLTQGLAGKTIIESGNGIIPLLPSSAGVNTFTGQQQLVAKTINLVTPLAGAGDGNDISLQAGSDINLIASNAIDQGRIRLSAATGGISGAATNGPIILQTTGNVATLLQNVTIEQKSERPNSLGSGGELYIKSGTQTILRGLDNLPGAGGLPITQRGPSIVLDYKSVDGSGVARMHTRFVGRQTWALQGESPELPQQGIQKLNDVRQQSEGIYELTNLGTNALPGLMSKAEHYVPLTSVQGDPSVIATRIADEMTGINVIDPTVLSPQGYPEGAFDRTIAIQSFENLTQSIGNDNYGRGNNQYFSFSKNKISFNNPLVFGRNQKLNAPALNYNPATDLNKLPNASQNVANSATYGVNTLIKLSPTNTLGMPTQAELGTSPPIVQITFAPSTNASPLDGTQPAADLYQAESGPMPTNPGDERPNTSNGPVVVAWNTGSIQGGFHFPVGAYPGQRIILIVRHFTTQYSIPAPGGALNQLLVYGNIQLLIPKGRRRSLQSNGNSGNGNWTSWWGSLYPASMFSSGERGYHSLTVNVSEAGGYDAQVAEVTYDMVWDGTTTTIAANGNGDIPNFPAPPQPTVASVQYQAGWRVLSKAFNIGSEEIRLGGRYPD
jgi:hypothetical protein